MESHGKVMEFHFQGFVGTLSKVQAHFCRQDNSFDQVYDIFLFNCSDTTSTAVVNHFRDLACAAHAGLCPTWQPNRALVYSVLGLLTDDIDNLVSF